MGARSARGRQQEARQRHGAPAKGTSGAGARRLSSSERRRIYATISCVTAVKIGTVATCARFRNGARVSSVLRTVSVQRDKDRIAGAAWAVVLCLLCWLPTSSVASEEDELWKREWSCAEQLAHLRETGDLILPEWSGSPRRMAEQVRNWFGPQVTIWSVYRSENLACVEPLLEELRRRADAGSLDLERSLGVMLIDLVDRFLVARSDYDAQAVIQKEAHDRLRHVAESGDAIGLWLFFKEHYSWYMVFHCPLHRDPKPWLLQMPEILSLLEELSVRSDPDMLLVLEKIALKGFCIASDPYRAMVYRTRWQRFTGSGEELCDGDLASCNRYLDYEGAPRDEW